MKRVLLTMVVSLFALTGRAQSGSITIRGHVEAPAPGGGDVEIIRSGDPAIIASSKVAGDGTYSLTMPVKEPGVYMIRFLKKQNVEFWAEDENLVIDFPPRDASHDPRTPGPVYVYIQGGPKNDLLNMVNLIRNREYWSSLDTRWDMNEVEGLTADQKKELGALVARANRRDSRVRYEYIIEHFGGDLTSVLAVLPLVKDDAEFYDKALAQYEKRHPGYAPLITYKERMAAQDAAEARVAVNAVPPPFSYETPDGSQKLGPQDFGGKYLLIDFWASWCGPCRAEMPNLKAAYEKYHDRGLEILSVSIDGDDAAWRKAMADEAMPWPQVKAPNAGRETAELYQFNAIPHIVLLGPDGKIIGKQYRGKALHEKMDELLDGKAAVAESAPKQQVVSRRR